MVLAKTSGIAYDTRGLSGSPVIRPSWLLDRWISAAPPSPLTDSAYRSWLDEQDVEDSLAALNEAREKGTKPLAQLGRELGLSE